MNNHDFAGAVAVRVGVLFGGASVSGPAGVADAVSSVEGLEADDVFEIAELALRAADLQAFAIASDGDAG